MAQRADGQTHVIPLSRWLTDREALVAFVLPQEAGSGPPEAIEAYVLESAAELAFERGHGEGHAEAEAQFNALRDADRLAAARREEELVAGWALRCSETMIAGIDAAFTQLQSSIECQLHSVLLPFLADAVRRQAIAELLQLTQREISRADEPALEIRAPAAVLGPLRDELGRLGIGAVLVEEDTVELRSRGGKAVFESMAGQWIETLRKRPGDE